MPCTYEPISGSKTYRRYSEQELKAVASTVKKGMPYRKGEMKCNIRRSVLSRRCTRCKVVLDESFKSVVKSTTYEDEPTAKIRRKKKVNVAPGKSFTGTDFER